jgi:hypothetical protein
MRNLTKIITGMAVVAFAITQANAGTIVFYSFDTNTYVGASGTYLATTNIWQHTATLGSSLSSLTVGPGILNSGTVVAGTALNENATTTPLSTFSSSLSSSGWTNNQAYYQFTLDATADSGVVVSYALNRSGTGPSTNEFQYSTDGGSTFTLFADYASPAAFNVYTNDLTGVTAINGDSTVVFRIYGLGATGGAGTMRIDNLTIDAVPEPSTMLLVGVGVLGMFAIRRRRS